MAYYCRKCKRWHTGGKIARAHTVFSARPPKSGLRPKTTKKYTKKLRHTKKIKNKQPLLVIKHKKKKTKGKPKDTFTPLRQPSIGLSKSRKGQLRMKPQDLYENKMVKRIGKKTGMTHIQVMNLVKLGQQNDYIDVETEIISTSNLSKDRTETYEFAKKRLLRILEKQGQIMNTSKYSDPDYFEEMQQDWLERERRRKKNKKMMDLI